jgi:beta-glucosidase
VEWLVKLGVGAYRFSLSWSRLLPEGKGRVNPRGVSFYDRLVDLLLARGIRPLVTLYHWDLPAALDDLGGWVSRDSADWFADYAEVAFRTLGDRVGLWATINEPWVVMDAGYVHGVHAPGHRSLGEAPLVAHNLLRAHARAVQRYREGGKGGIGLVVNLEPKTPASSSAADVAAARRADAYMNRFFLEPLFLGRYPAELSEIFGPHWPSFPAEDWTLLQEPTDYLGVNYYTRGVMRHDDTALPARAAYATVPGAAYTATRWEVHPESFPRVLAWAQEQIGDLPIYVTENGAAFADPDVATSDPVEDPRRTRYYAEHLRAAREALARGVRLAGYFAWSLLDNFEWSEGYAKRFGLLHVEFETQKRTPKRSFHFYREVVRSNGAALDGPA